MSDIYYACIVNYFTIPSNELEEAYRTAFEEYDGKMIREDDLSLLKDHLRTMANAINEKIPRQTPIHPTFHIGNNGLISMHSIPGLIFHIKEMTLLNLNR